MLWLYIPACESTPYHDLTNNSSITSHHFVGQKICRAQLGSPSPCGITQGHLMVFKGWLVYSAGQAGGSSEGWALLGSSPSLCKRLESLSCLISPAEQLNFLHGSSEIQETKASSDSHLQGQSWHQYSFTFTVSHWSKHPQTSPDSRGGKSRDAWVGEMSQNVWPSLFNCT